MTFSIQQITAAAVASLTLAAGVAIAQTTPGTGSTGGSSSTQPMTQQNSTTGNTGSVGTSASGSTGTTGTTGNMNNSGTSTTTGMGSSDTDTSRTDLAFTDRAARADRN